MRKKRSLSVSLSAVYLLFFFIPSIFGSWTEICAQEEKLPSIDAKDRARMQELEQHLFARKATADELQKLLEQLPDADQREVNMTELEVFGRGCQKEIAEFANSSADIGVREACADVVARLDDGWRDTAKGKEFIALCKKNSEAMFPSAWIRFVGDPTDQSACAMVLAAEPEKVWKWLEERNANFKLDPNVVRNTGTPTEADQGRYMLLRIRELSPDEFTAKRIPERPKWLYYAHEIFPDGNSRRFRSISTNTCYRVVGHVRLKTLEGISVSDLRGHYRKYYSFCPKQYHAFRFDSNKLAGRQWIQFESMIYGEYFTDNSGAMLPLTAEQTASSLARHESEFVRSMESTFVRSTESTSDALAVVPLLHLSEEHFDVNPMTMQQMTGLPNRHGLPVPWWWKPYISPANQRRMEFSIRKDGSKAPAEISDEPMVGLAPTGVPVDAIAPAADAPSFVVLPPRLERVSESHLLAAELACDRISEELERRSVRIVDRKFLKQILDERSMAEISKEPLAGFDVFVRLQIVNDHLDAEAILSVIDLSTGSSLASETFAWPIKEANIGKIRNLLDATITKVRQPDEHRVKIRLLGTQQPEAIRLRPMALQLTQAFDASFRENKQLLVVDHLEAGSAAEESLLLLMGLTRLPGGRRFGPMADATLGLTLAERDAGGKTFENTEVEVRSWLQVLGHDEQSDVVTRTVSEFESRLVPEILRRTNVRLGKVEPGTAERLMGDFNARQIQARRELAALTTIDASLSRLNQANARRYYAQSALFLDPTSKDAVIELVNANREFLRVANVKDPERQYALHEMIDVVTDRLEEFVSSPDALRVMENAIWDAKGDYKLRERSEASIRIAEASTSGSVTGISGGLFMLVEGGFIGLKQRNVSVEELRPRLIGIIDNLDKRQIELTKLIANQPVAESFEIRSRRVSLTSSLQRLRKSALIVSIRLNFLEEYDRLLPAVQADVEEGRVTKAIAGNLTWQLAALTEPTRRAELDKWLKELQMKSEQPEVSIVKSTWPNADVFANSKIETAQTEAYTIDVPADFSICPLVKTRNRLYFLANDARFLGWNSMLGSNSSGSPRQKFGYVPLKDDGQQSGPAVFVPLPPDARAHTIRSCVANEESLAIGTGGFRENNSGLYLLNLSDETWKYFGIEQGLPAATVNGMHMLSGDRVLCIGLVQHSDYACFTFDLKSHAIRKYAVGVVSEPYRIPYKLTGVYQEGKIVSGYGRYGRWQNLLSTTPELIHLQPETGPTKGERYYHYTRDACRVLDKIYFVNDNGIHQARLSGEVVRTWAASSATGPESHTSFELHLISTPQSPQLGGYLISCNDLLLQFQWQGNRAVAYDPKTDTWYGPVQIPQTIYAVADGEHIWLGGQTLQRLSTSKIISSAKRCDRAMTTAEFASRQASLIEKMSGVKRAKIELMRGRLSESKKYLEQILEEHPKYAHAHFINAVLHDTWGLNEPEIAGTAYQLAEHDEEHASMRFTCAYLRAQMFVRSGRLSEASAAAKKMLVDYPNMGFGLEDRVRRIATGAK